MDCLFCNIARGYEPAQVALEDDEFMAFADIFPKAETHLIVIPRDHHADLDAWVAAGGSSERMLRFVSRAAAAVGAAGGYRLITNVGSDAGQVIFHLHWHVMAGRLRAF